MAQRGGAWRERLDESRGAARTRTGIRAVVLGVIVLLAAAMVVVTFNESGGAQVQTELQHSAGGRGQQARHTKLSRAAAETPQRSAQAPPAKAKAVTDLQVTEARITADKFVVQDPVITKAFRDSIKEVYVKRVQPAQGCTRPVKVLLLHGAAFSASVWAQIGTLNVLGENGYCVVATDLPGYGRSQGRVASPFRGAYLQALVAAEGLENTVIVSPSMSGAYALPYVTAAQNKVAGFVPIAPSGVDEYKSRYSTLTIPTMILYGGKDSAGAKGSQTLASIPNSRVHKFPNATHPCYVDDPVRFHQLLLEFLAKLT